MDVSCPQCDTIYELDDRQLRGPGIKLKCSQCDHLFKLDAQLGTADESDRRWMARRVEAGDILYFKGFDTLHEWIMEGRISEYDEISRTGDSWTKLHEIGEFAPIFQVVASIADLSGGNQPTMEQGAATEQRSGGTEPSHRPAPSTGDSSPAAAPSNDMQSPVAGPSAPKDRHSATAEQVEPDSGPRSRKGTTPQFQGADAGSDRAPSQPQRPRSNTDQRIQRPSPENQPEQRRPPAHKPKSSEPPAASPDVDRQPEQTPGSGESPTASPDVDRQSAPPASDQARAESSEDIQLEDSRFSSQPEPEPAIGADQTLGELEYGLGSGEDEEIAYPGRRRWPWVVLGVVVLGAGVAVGVWQWEVVEEWAVTAGLSSPEADHGSVIEEPAEDAEPGEPLQVVDTAVVEAFAMAHAEARQVAMEAALSGTLEPVEEAVQTADDAARSAAERAARGPETAGEWIRAGRRSLDRGNAGQARQRFEQALEQAPDHAEAVVGLGWAHLSDGQLQSAVAEFRRAMELDAGLGEALIGIGRAERNRGNERAALSAYEEYLERFSGGQHASIAEYQSQQLRRQLGED